MTATQYIKSLRKPQKRQYAAMYLDYLQHKIEQEPDYKPYGLSFMGAQAVRFALAQIIMAKPN